MSAVIAALVAAIHVFVDPRDKRAGDGVELDHHSKPQPGTDDLPTAYFRSLLTPLFPLL